MSRPPVLDARTLNRTLLHRQRLLERTELGAAETLEHLVGMQGQEPLDPYIGLWSRTSGYEPGELAELMRRGGAVRATLMRGTIHMVTADDYLTVRATLAPMIERVFHSASPFGRALGDVDFDEIVAAGREHLAEAPRTRAELSRLLARRYLRAFGPASIADIRAWSGLTGVRELVEPLRPRLRTFRSERGTELLDLPDAPIAEADRPAPVRFLPYYDNAALGHADRSRVVPAIERPPLFAGYTGNLGGLLVDGFFRGLWRHEVTGDTALLRIEVTKPLSKRAAAAVTAEGRRLLALLADGAAEREVRIAFPG